MVKSRRLVVLACFVLFCVVSLIYGFATSSLYAASASEITIKGGASLVGLENWIITNSSSKNSSAAKEVTTIEAYAFDPYLQLSYSEAAVKSEIKFHFDIDKDLFASTTKIVLDKAYVRFRVPTFENKKLTMVAGKAPVSWGMGQLYRGGDLLFSSTLSNVEAGVDVENNTWVVSVSHPLFTSTSLDLAFVPAVEDIKCEKVGALFKFSPQADFLKEIRLSYVYSDSQHQASALVDMNLYFDINVAVETAFRASDDFRVVANLYKAFSIETDYESHSLNLYLSYQGDFYNETQDLTVVLSYALTDRTSITAYQSNSWTSGNYTQLSGSLYSTTNLANGVELTILSAITTNPNSSSSNYNLACGTRLKYSF